MRPFLIPTLLVLVAPWVSADEETQENKPVTLTFTVRDAEGQPVPSARYQLRIIGSKSSHSRSGNVDKKGTLTFKQARVGDILIFNAFSKNLISEQLLQTVDSDAAKHHFEVTLQPGLRVTGQATLIGKSTPIARQPISILQNLELPDGRKQDCSICSTSTKEDGRFEVWLHPGDYILSSPTFGPHQHRRRPFHVAAEAAANAELDVLVRRPFTGTLRVHVVDTDGEPVPGISVQATNGSVKKTDANGVCFWDYSMRQDGMILVREMLEDGSTIRRAVSRVVSGDTEEIKLVLQPTVTLRGRLVDADMDEPATNLDIHLQEGWWQIEDFYHFRLHGNQRTVVVDSNGCFEFTNLPAGSFYQIAYSVQPETTGEQSSGSMPKIRLGNVILSADNTILPDIAIHPYQIQQHRSENKIEFPESEKQFIERLGETLTSAAARGRHTLLYFSDRPTFDGDDRQPNRPLDRHHLFTLTPIAEELSVHDLMGRYEMIGGEVDFCKPGETVTFITEQLGVDLTREATGVLCLLDETGRLIAKRSFAELAYPDDPGMIDIDKFRTFMKAPAADASSDASEVRP